LNNYKYIANSNKIQVLCVQLLTNTTIIKECIG